VLPDRKLHRNVEAQSSSASFRRKAGKWLGAAHHRQCRHRGRAKCPDHPASGRARAPDPPRPRLKLALPFPARRSLSPRILLGSAANAPRRAVVGSHHRRRCTGADRRCGGRLTFGPRCRGGPGRRRGFGRLFCFSTNHLRFHRRRLRSGTIFCRLGSGFNGVGCVFFFSARRRSTSGFSCAGSARLLLDNLRLRGLGGGDASACRITGPARDRRASSCAKTMPEPCRLDPRW